MTSMENAFVRDPVRVSWVTYTFIQSVVAVLLVADILSTVVAGIIVGISAAAYAAVSELFVRPDTVPRVPLEELARAQAPPR